MLRQLKRTAVRTTATTLGLGLALEVTTHLPSEGRSSALYHAVSDDVVMPLIRFLRLDPEWAHNLALEAVQRGWAPTYRPAAGRTGYGGGDDGWRVQMDSAPFGGGVRFPNPVGLAAGFDKDGVAVGGLLALGFG